MVDAPAGAEHSPLFPALCHLKPAQPVGKPPTWAEPSPTSVFVSLLNSGPENRSVVTHPGPCGILRSLGGPHPKFSIFVLSRSFGKARIRSASRSQIMPSATRQALI